MIHEFQYPIPCNTKHGEGYIWYCRDGGTFENDVYCVVLCEGGLVRHYRADQLTIADNGTFDIKNKDEQKAGKETKEAGGATRPTATTQSKRNLSKAKGGTQRK